MMQRAVLHYPRLDTVMMVEDTIKKMNCYPTKMQLWKALPKKVMYQTYCLIIDYLSETGRIVIDKREIVWVWDPEGIEKMKKKGLIIR